MANVVDEILARDTGASDNIVDSIIAANQPQSQNNTNIVDSILQQSSATQTAPSPQQPKTYTLQHTYAPQPYSKGLENVLKHTGGAVMGVMEKLDRPRSMLVSGIQAAMGDRPASDIVEAAKGNVHPSFSEVLPDMNVPAPKWIDPDDDGQVNLKHAVGFGLDVVADPLNAVGVGVLTKGGKAARALSMIGKAYGDDAVRGILSKAPEAIDALKARGVSPKLLELASKADAPLAATLPEQAKAGQWAAASFAGINTPKKINVAASTGVDAARRALPRVPVVNQFINRTGDDAWDEGVRNLDYRHRQRTNEILDVGRATRQDIDRLGEEAFGGQSSAAWLESGGYAAEAATQEQRAMAQRVIDLNNAQREQMRRLGIPLEAIEEQGYTYVPHTLTDEAKNEMRSSRFFTKGKLPTSKTPQSLPRDYRWITDPDTGEEFVGSVRAFAAERGIDPKTLQTRNATVDEINSAVGSAKFKTDLAEATTEAALRNERAISGAEQLNFFYQHAKEDILKAGPETPKHWRKPRLEVPERFISKDGQTHRVRSMLTELADMPMPPEKARVLEGRWKTVAQPEETAKQLSDLYKAYESAWKRYTLFLFPEYHVRNVIGDIWMGWMHGWKPQQIGKDMYDAARIQSKAGKSRKIKTALYGDVNGETLIKTARDYGVIGTGQLSEIDDILAPINSEKGKSIMKKVKEHAWDLKVPMKISETLENNRRLALFIRKLKDGDTYEEAANSVAKTLYDYGDITPFERDVMRRAFPFYTWMRKNLPAQVENLVRRPGKVAAMPKIKGAFEGAQEDTPPEETRPDWMRREFSIYTGRGDDGKSNFAMLGSYLPTADLFRLGSSPEDAVAGLTSSLTPPVKVAAELATNRDFFRDRPIDTLREEGEWSDLLWGNERTNYLGMNMPTTVQRLSELLPFTRALATADRMNPGGIFDEYAPTADGQTRPYHDEMSAFQNALKFTTGLKNYPVDLEREAMYRLLDLRRDSSRAPGLNISNVRSLARRAYLEGDTESYNYYLSLIDDILSKANQEIGLWNSYVR